jgi:starch synthase
MTSKSLKIAHVIAEVSPYSKVGGLGDVGHALPKAIARLGHEVIIVTPYYGLVRKLNLKKEKIDADFSITIAGIDYPVSYRKFISPDGLQIYFVVNEELFGSHNKVYRAMEDEALRWIFFDQASIRLLKLINFKPDIIHTHDWHIGLVSNYIKTIFKTDEFYKDSAIIYTIHNLNYQGAGDVKFAPKSRFDKATGEPPVNKSFRANINFAKRAIVYADAISTVSERYASEILTPEFGMGLDSYLKRRKDRLFGIINGIDYEVVNPKFDKNVYINFDHNSLDKKFKNKAALQKEIGLAVDKDVPLIGVVNRLTEQKGFLLIMEALPALLKMKLQLVIVGSGNRDYIKFFREVARKYPDKIAVCSPFTEQMASRVYAGSDIYLMPSRFEPCGISQLISLRYGSIPVVHSVGGLHDTVSDFDPHAETGNGFAFQNYNKEELLVAIARATESYKYKNSWNKLAQRAMKQSFSWDLPAKKYVELYQIALKRKRTGF